MSITSASTALRDLSTGVVANVELKENGEDYGVHVIADESTDQVQRTQINNDELMCLMVKILEELKIISMTLQEMGDTQIENQDIDERDI